MEFLCWGLSAKDVKLDSPFPSSPFPDAPSGTFIPAPAHPAQRSNWQEIVDVVPACAYPRIYPVPMNQEDPIQATADLLRQLAAAKEAGDLAEVERLRAEMDRVRRERLKEPDHD